MPIAAHALNEPNSGGIADAQIPTGMHRHTWFDLQRTDPSLTLQVLQGIGIDSAKDWRFERTEKFLLKIGRPLDLSILLDDLALLDQQSLIGNDAGIVNGGDLPEPMRFGAGNLQHPMRMILAAWRGDE